MNKKSVVFISTNTSWGGSEELWASAANHLAHQGVTVRASIGYDINKKIQKLKDQGVDIHFRPKQYPFLTRALARVTSDKRTLADADIEKFLSLNTSDLVVISDGMGMLRAAGILKFLYRTQRKFVTLSQLNGELFWPDDDLAELFRKTLELAKRCYFVSHNNRRLFETQIGCRLPNAEIVPNAFNLDAKAAPPWAAAVPLRLANVARLEPLIKGQDLLLEALATPLWRDRDWRLTFYGEGAMRNCIERLVKELDLTGRVQFAGHVSSVERIWAENHVLVMSSRYEGMPLAIIEAMLCGRPVVATDVGGNREIITEGVTGFLAEAPTALALSSALDRMWARRKDFELMGKTIAKTIRDQIPLDPARAFAEKLFALLH
jgi:glycosyltransferase involved in cell wall biosynthesis